MCIGNKQARQLDWQKNDDDRVEGSARQGVELGVEETETGRKVVEGGRGRERERATHLDVGTAKVGFLRPWPVVRKFVRLAVILLGDRVHHQLSRGASVGGGVHVLWSRPSVRGEASVSRKKSYSQTHTHTHTHHRISLFLSVTHSGKLDLHLQPLAHQGPPCPCLSGW